MNEIRYNKRGIEKVRKSEKTMNNQIQQEKEIINQRGKRYKRMKRREGNDDE